MIAGLRSAMSRILPAKEGFHIQSAALAGIERLQTPVYFSAKRVELFDMRKQFAADLLLIGKGKPGNLRNGLFERSDHGTRLAYCEQARFKNWSGRRESNPRMQLGKLPFYH